MPTPYDVLDGDSYKVAMLKTLRGKLANDSLLVGQFQGNIRKFPLTSVRETAPGSTDFLPPGVALYSPVNKRLKRATMGGVTVGRSETVFSCCLEVALCERPKDADPDYLDDLSERLQNAYDKFERALLRYPTGPTVLVNGVQCCMWDRMEFSEPVTVEYRKISMMMFSHTYFNLIAQRLIS